MNKAEAEQVASAITMIRPDWLRTSLVTLLAKHQHRPARDVMLALTWVAFDPETKKPGRINEEGPWWAITRTAGLTETPTPPGAAYCTPHHRPQPCQECSSHHPVEPQVARQRIAEIRAQIRTARHKEPQP